LVVGLISDTHGLVRPEITRIFGGVDLIVHAGDVGTGVLAALSKIAPVDAVYGNVDDAHDPALARERYIPIGGLVLHVSHGHELGSPTPTRVADRYDGDVLIFGHTHRAVVVELKGAQGRPRWVVNPGAAGPKRFDVVPSVGLLTVAAGIAAVEIIELA
jgi:hypothetical protein